MRTGAVNALDGRAPDAAFELVAKARQREKPGGL